MNSSCAGTAMSVRIRIVVLAALLLASGITIIHSYREARHSLAVSRSGNGSASAEPRVGAHAPDFSLPDINGRTYTLSNLQGHETSLAFFCGCDRCRAASRAIANQQRQGELGSLISVVAMTPGAVRDWQRQTGLQGRVLSDATDSVAEKYNSLDCPRLWAISASGTVAYQSGKRLEGKRLADAMASIVRMQRQSRSVTSEVHRLCCIGASSPSTVTGEIRFCPKKHGWIWRLMQQSQVYLEN